jgi:hypothetical protein
MCTTTEIIGCTTTEKMDCNNFMYRAFDEFELQGKYYKVSVTEGHEQAQTGRDEQGKCRQEKAEGGSTD